MLDLNVLIVLGGLALVVLLTALSSRSAQRFWEKCRNRLSCPPTQERINQGNAESR
jgi:hypothetical protein